jgi:transcriptional antiterminator RfaH
MTTASTKDISMSELMTTEERNWYAVYTKPREEERAESNLRAWGMKTFMPRIKEQRGGNSTSKGTVKYLFPRYLFAHFNSNSGELHKVIYTRGVCNVVRFGDIPCPIDDFIIETIMSQVGREGFITIDDSIRRGDQVRITDGPFRELVGTVDSEMSDHDRLVVLLSSVSYQGRIMIERALVRKITRGH